MQLLFFQFHLRDQQQQRQPVTVSQLQIVLAGGRTGSGGQMDRGGGEQIVMELLAELLASVKWSKQRRGEGRSQLNKSPSPEAPCKHWDLLNSVCLH